MPPIMLAIVALAIGTGIGWLVQHVLTSLRYNGDWPCVPKWKKRNLAATGAIAALATGLYVLQGAPNFRAEEFLFRLWFVQTVAAPGGATVLDVLAQRLRGGGR